MWNNAPILFWKILSTSSFQIWSFSNFFRTACLQAVILIGKVFTKFATVFFFVWHVFIIKKTDVPLPKKNGFQRGDQLLKNSSKSFEQKNSRSKSLWNFFFVGLFYQLFFSPKTITLRKIRNLQKTFWISKTSVFVPTKKLKEK